jgi:ABC-type nickel/cobalt efflux system permease component RcnA
MNWKKVLRITAVTLIPGGLVILGGWLAVKKLRSSHEEHKKCRSDLAKHDREHAEKEAEHDFHSVSNE